MHIRDTEDNEHFQINLTPLIDMVFLLLIFFMCATSFLDPEREIGIELPQAVSGEAPGEAPDELIINVLQDGTLIVSGRETDQAGLAAALERAARKSAELPVTIRGDRLVHHERIVQVMDACGAAGLTNLAVGTLDASGG
ncbi:MAG: biopolymer transporter ExbD [Planctomycetes bacterium]|nr:biopolymer transporter ExbD [Planctomycetota bacterium]